MSKAPLTPPPDEDAVQRQSASKVERDVRTDGEADRVILAAAELQGDIERAEHWFRNEPIADHGHRTPAQLVDEGHSEAVMSYLRDLENGACG